MSADVYAWGGGRVLKLFHASVPAGQARREYHATLSVARMGLPAPAVYDLVELDGRAGIVMERVDGPSMFERVQARPWTLVRAARELSDLHAQVHRTTSPSPAELPSRREQLAEQIAGSVALSHDEKQRAADRLAGLPDGAAVCHGDFHPANILYPPARGNAVIIDWGGAARGHPLGDVACTSRLMRRARLPASAPRYMHALLKCSRSLLHRVYLRRSLELHGATLREVHAWEPVLDAAGALR